MLGASRGDVWSAQKTFERWLELDACRVRATDARVDRIPNDETALIVHHGSDCRDRVEVRLYELQGGGHTWPMGASYAREWLVGRVSQELDATREIWNFMQANARSPGPWRDAMQTVAGSSFALACGGDLPLSRRPRPCRAR